MAHQSQTGLQLRHIGRQLQRRLELSRRIAQPLFVASPQSALNVTGKLRGPVLPRVLLLGACQPASR